MDNGQIQVQFIEFPDRKRVAVTQIKDTSTEYGGEFIRKYLFAGTVSDEELAYAINIEGTYCQHEWDCCGNYYLSSARIKRDGIRTLVLQKGYQNV